MLNFKNYSDRKTDVFRQKDIKNILGCGNKDRLFVDKKNDDFGQKDRKKRFIRHLRCGSKHLRHTFKDVKNVIHHTFKDVKM